MFGLYTQVCNPNLQINIRIPRIIILRLIYYMITDFQQPLFFFETLIFLSVIFMHLSKKSASVIYLYMIQSFIVAILLFNSFVKDLSFALLFVAIIIFGIKVIIAPYFFFGLVKKHQLKFSSSTYLNGPSALIVLAVLTAITYSHLFRPLSALSPNNENSLLLAVAMMFISIFLMINRKGALSQMIGILSLENGIVSFASFAGLEQSPGLQLGILFDILVWIIIATVFTSMIFKQFGSLDVTTMRHLKEE